MKAIAIVCSLKPTPEPSSSELIARQLLGEFARHDVTGSLLRAADYDIQPGVSRSMGETDDWPKILERILEADILIISTPTWVGHMSSFAQRVLERLDAELSETKEDGTPSMFGKVAVTAVVGNEDGAHKITADLMQGLNDIGFSVPAQGGTYWNGEAMQGTDYQDLDETPKAVASTNATVATNAAHLARLLARAPYPPPPD